MLLQFEHIVFYPKSGSHMEPFTCEFRLNGFLRPCSIGTSIARRFQALLTHGMMSLVVDDAISATARNPVETAPAQPQDIQLGDETQPALSKVEVSGATASNC